MVASLYTVLTFVNCNSQAMMWIFDYDFIYVCYHNLDSHKSDSKMQSEITSQIQIRRIYFKSGK